MKRINHGGGKIIAKRRLKKEQRRALERKIESAAI
jgi:hypothetical protein